MERCRQQWSNFIKVNKSKHAIFLITLCVLFFHFVKAQKNITIVNCDLGFPISKVSISYTDGLGLVISDTLGRATIAFQNPKQILLFNRAGYKSLKCNYEQISDSVCMTLEGYSVKEVVVENNELDHLSLLETMVSQSLEKFLDTKVNSVYLFNYELSLRDISSTFKAIGFVSLEHTSYSKQYHSLGRKAKLHLLEFEVDSNLWGQEKLGLINDVIPLLAIWEDPMRKGGFLRSLTHMNHQVSKASNKMEFLIDDSVGSRSFVYFNRDSSIYSLSQYRSSENYLIIEDSICYNDLNQRYFSYKHHMGVFESKLGLVDFKISLKSVNSNTIETSNGIPFGVLFKPLQSFQEYDITLTINK